MRNPTYHLKRPSVVFLPDPQAACRCGAPSLHEACKVCEQFVCQDCAVFVDPATRVPTRPSLLLARGLSKGFLAHRGCMSQHDSRHFPCVYSKDVPLMVQIIKGVQPLGRSPKK